MRNTARFSRKAGEAHVARHSFFRRIRRDAAAVVAVAERCTHSRLLSLLRVRAAAGADFVERSVVVARPILVAATGFLFSWSSVHRVGDRWLPAAQVIGRPAPARVEERQSGLREHHDAGYGGRVSLDSASLVCIVAGAVVVRVS